MAVRYRRPSPALGKRRVEAYVEFMARRRRNFCSVKPRTRVDIVNLSASHVKERACGRIILVAIRRFQLFNR